MIDWRERLARPAKPSRPLPLGEEWGEGPSVDVPPGSSAWGCMACLIEAVPNVSEDHRQEV